VALTACTITAAQDPCGAFTAWSAPPHTRVISAKTIPADKERGLSRFCEVRVTISPAYGSQIAAVYRLPEPWNGKILGVGGGGAAGNITIEAATTGLLRRYAVIQNDLGHPSTNTTDWTFAVKAAGQPNAEAIIDFGHRATHLATTIGKAVVAQFYGRPARHAYWQGCSTGGRQGLAEVQRYPQDYDGVIAGAPVHAARYYSTVVLRVQAFHKYPDSNLLPEHVLLIQKAVLAACDAQDGLADGVLTDPRTCTWDPGELLCKGPASPQCLTQGQMEAVRHVYTGAKARDGRFAMFPLMRGGESEWVVRMIGTRTLPRGINALLGAPFVAHLVRHDPAYDFMTFDPERDLEDLRDGLAEHVYQENADISAFVGRGGKLLLWHGFNDPGPSPLSTIEYFEAVTAEVPAAKDAVRLFLAPGVFHCGGGAGPDRFDTLTALEQWVEKGTAPASLIASSADGSLSRPLCPYPQLARYSGKGDTKQAASFECATRTGGQ
jgi:feruloyl esterase